jgi:hypothetical protein
MATALLMAGTVKAQVHPDTDPATLPGPNDDLTGTQYGRALIFLDGPIDWEATAAANAWTNPVYNTPSEVLLTNLGIYDTNGVMVSTNGGALTGRYLDTFVSSISLYGIVPTMNVPSNDFRVDFTGSENSLPRESLLWNSEGHLYYYINDYKVRFLDDNFIGQLNLSTQTQLNLKFLQYRPDFQTGTRFAKPTLQVDEEVQPSGLGLFPDVNFVTAGARPRADIFETLPPISVAYDDSVIVGDYAGLVSFWMIGSNQGWPSEIGFAQNNDWKSNMLPALNDGLSAWVGYRYSGDYEVNQTFRYFGKLWGNKTCGVLPPAGPVAFPENADNISCDQGENIRNVMMYDDNNFFHSGNFSVPGVFPFDQPSGITGFHGPSGSDLSAMYVGAVFYDIASEAGLGIHKADLLIWKTVSWIDNVTNFPMRTFGAKIQEAARMLWPDGGGMSIYEDDIVDVLTSRGIPMNGAAVFTTNLPPVIGTFPETLEQSSGSQRGFGTDHPMIQPTENQYGLFSANFNGYTTPETNASYFAYEFYKHSKIGPADEIRLTDGTYNPSNGDYNGDGSYFHLLKDREPGNLIVLSPGRTIRWVWWGARADNELEGFYAEDVRPFGFRVIKATPNGFSFTVEELSHVGDPLEKAFEQSGELVGVKTYRTSIVDPSLRLIGDAAYNWTVTDYLGVEQNGIGKTFTFDVELDQPFTIYIERDRGGQIDTLTLRERANDFARSGGRAFVYDATDNLGPPPKLDIDLTTAGDLELSWPNSPTSFVPYQAQGSTPPIIWTPQTSDLHEASGRFLQQVDDDTDSKMFRLERQVSGP